MIDLVSIAGGFTSSANQDSVELAVILKDSDCIVVSKLSVNEIKTITSTLININSATSAELMTLSGIGEAKAMAIISYREANGKFKSIYDLTNVKGISDGILAKIIDYITV